MILTSERLFLSSDRLLNDEATYWKKDVRKFSVEDYSTLTTVRNYPLVHWTLSEETEDASTEGSMADIDGPTNYGSVVAVVEPEPTPVPNTECEDDRGEEQVEEQDMVGLHEQQHTLDDAIDTGSSDIPLIEVNLV